MEIEKGAVVMTVSPQSWLKQYYVNRSVAAGRLTRFWGYVSMIQRTMRKQIKKRRTFVHRSCPNCITPFLKGVANRRFCNSA